MAECVTGKTVLPSEFFFVCKDKAGGYAGDRWVCPVFSSVERASLSAGNQPVQILLERYAYSEIVGTFILI